LTPDPKLLDVANGARAKNLQMHGAGLEPEIDFQCHCPTSSTSQGRWHRIQSAPARFCR